MAEVYRSSPGYTPLDFDQGLPSGLAVRRVTMKSIGIAVALLTLASAVSMPAVAQDRPATTAGPPSGAAARPWTTPRTPWGEPDLQGAYSNRTITPFERPANVGGREFFTKQEMAALESQVQQSGGDEGRTKGTVADVARAYNDFWWDRGTKATTARTSLVVDPPNGLVPALTEDAKKRAEDEPKRPAFRGTGATGRGTDSWLDRGTLERCLTRGMPGAMSPTAYNNNYRFVQAPGYVAIQIEMLGGTRVIPTDGRSHVRSSIRQLMVLYRGAAENLHLVERFTRVGQNEIEYRVTVNDPTTFVRPWTLVIPFVNTGEEMFEYACHEGNYGMEGILSGARAEERANASGK
jgi:hypothetical protein